jgi:subtilase family serine protease
MVRASDHRPLAGPAGPPADALTPAEIQSAYRLPTTGHGQTVAVVDAYGYSPAAADLAVFRKQYGLPACTTGNGCFRKVDQQGGSNYPADDPSWSTETALDLDAVSSACPACNILLVEANSDAVSDLGASVKTAVALGAKFVSNSYGAPDAAVAGRVSDTDYNQPGVVVTASTGDVGGAIEWPSSNPNVVAVGGTTLTAAPGTSRGWTEAAWSEGGSGCSSFEPQPVYQSDQATGCAHKATADISADADPDSGLAEYDSLNGDWVQVGGTSLASPLIASMYALAGTPAAATYPVTYPYIHASGGLFDVTTGTNGTCGNVLCTAGPGWDGPTGLGTPNGVAALAMGPQGTVTGTVTNSTSGTPLAGVSVVLTDTADQLTFRAITDSTGRYQVSVSAGTFDVAISEFGFGTNTIGGVVVTATRPQTRYSRRHRSARWPAGSPTPATAGRSTQRSS